MDEINNTESNVEDNNQATSEEIEQTPTQVEPKLTKRLKLKVDSQEFDEDLPFEIDENNKDQVDFLKRHLQMSKAASKRMHEAANIRKQAEQFIEALQNDPMRVLSNPKIMGEERFRAIAEQYLASKLQEQMLSPEERKRIEMEEKLRSYEEQERKSKEEQEATQMQQLQEHYAEQYQKVIIDALKLSNLPKNPFTVSRMATLMQKNLQFGLELEPAQLAQMTREDYQKELVSLVGSSEPEQIIALFGEDLTTKIRKHDLQKLKSSSFNNQRSFSTEPTPSSSKPKPMTRDEWREHLNKRIKD